MLQEGTILAVFDEDTAELAAEYHMEDAYDNCSTAMSGGGGGGGAGGDRPDGRGTPDPHRTYPWHGGLHAGRDRSLSALGQQYPHAGRGV